MAIEWTLTGLPTDVVDDQIEIMLSNDTGTHTSRAEVKQQVTAGAFDPGSSENLFVPVLLTSGNNPFVAYGVINDGGRPGQRSGDGAYLPARE